MTASQLVLNGGNPYIVAVAFPICPTMWRQSVLYHQPRGQAGCPYCFSAWTSGLTPSGRNSA